VTRNGIGCTSSERLGPVLVSVGGVVVFGVVPAVTGLLEGAVGGVTGAVPETGAGLVGGVTWVVGAGVAVVVGDAVVGAVVVGAVL
jgi:hypothetical protein